MSLGWDLTALSAQYQSGIWFSLEVDTRQIKISSLWDEKYAEKTLAMVVQPVWQCESKIGLLNNVTSGPAPSNQTTATINPQQIVKIRLQNARECILTSVSHSKKIHSEINVPVNKEITPASNDIKD